MAALNDEDKRFVEQALQRLRLPAVAVERAGRGDISVAISSNPAAVPRIRVGDKWARAGAQERRKRLLHELLHVKGLRHDAEARAMGYYSNPRRDRLSRTAYRHITGG